jgi:hypothetical protein
MMSVQQSIDFVVKLKSIFEQVCEQFDSRWQTRKRILNTYFLVLFIFKLVLCKHKQGYNSILCELWDSAEGNMLELPQKNPIAASSICEARQKMPENIFQKINEEILQYWRKNKPASTWRGHEVFAADGLKLNLPHELSKEGYHIYDKEHRHYPTGLVSVLYHLGERMAYDFVLQSHMDERRCVIEHMDKMSLGDILVLDRGYFSYLLLFKSLEKGIHVVCRIQCGTVNGEIKKFLDSEKTDAIIKYYPSETVKSDLRKRGFDLDFKKIPLRLIKYTINDEIYVCATTLVGENYPTEEFSKLYHGRWGIEELYKISKHFLDIEGFHSKTERGVKQEIYAHLLLINIARIFESEAKGNAKSSATDDFSHELRDNYWQDFCENLQKIKVNFKNCLLVVGRHMEQLFLASSFVINKWLPKAIAAIVRVRQKIRPGRHYLRHSFKPITKWARNKYLRNKAIRGIYA